ncbi:MAG: YbhB/YbcL family Raf kinase inhibitor-like protein [Acidimicrobiales bacterium]|nr:YbhB/YbcL family Raf kinase inhibitor-like protein [Acidimicrobiales bacterium]
MDGNPYDALPEIASFAVTSSDLRHNERLPNDQVSAMMDAGGRDISPHLSWSGYPEATRSFVVTAFDPDAPTGSGFWHWAVVDIPATVNELPRGAGGEGGDGLPPGAFQLRNDLGQRAYLGAAPPPGHGRHHYYFAVHAVDVESLGVPADATNAFLGFNLFGHAIGRGLLVCWYER